MENNLTAPKAIKTSSLTIEGNCLEFEDTVIQLSNISLFDVGYVPPPKFPLASLVLLVIGFILYYLLEEYWMPETVKLASIVLMIIGSVWIVLWLLSQGGNLENLRIITNSGNVFCIQFDNRKFLRQVLEVMKNCIRDPAHTQSIYIDIGDNNIITGNSVNSNNSGSSQ